MNISLLGATQFVTCGLQGSMRKRDGNNAIKAVVTKSFLVTEVRTNFCYEGSWDFLIRGDN